MADSTTVCMAVGVMRWHNGCSITLVIKSLQVRLPVVPLSSNAHYHQAVQFGIGQRAVILSGWEGNCMPGEM